jgi:hypothetical protein
MSVLDPVRNKQFWVWGVLHPWDSKGQDVIKGYCLNLEVWIIKLFIESGEHPSGANI